MAPLCMTMCTRHLDELAIHSMSTPPRSHRSWCWDPRLLGQAGRHVCKDMIHLLERLKHCEPVGAPACQLDTPQHCGSSNESAQAPQIAWAQFRRCFRCPHRCLQGQV